MTTTNKKMTKAQAWNIVREIVATSAHPQTAELLEKLDNELVLLAKKNSSERKNPKTEANDALKEEILACMVAGERYTITDMLKTFPCCSGLSSQKVSAVMRKLIPAKVQNEVEKGRSYYFLA